MHVISRAISKTLGLAGMLGTLHFRGRGKKENKDEEVFFFGAANQKYIFKINKKDII